MRSHTAQAGSTTAADAPVAGGPLLEVAIHVLADGSVVFGDLTPELAEVARILAGVAPADPGGMP